MASIWPHVVNKAFTSGASITQANMLYAEQSKTIEKKEKEKKRKRKRKSCVKKKELLEKKMLCAKRPMCAR